jgi:hypothetical protein
MGPGLFEQEPVRKTLMPTVTIGDNTGGSANTHAGTIDTQLKSDSPTTNYGGDATFEVHKYAVGNHAHGLIAFPGLSNITGPVVVTAASLWLYMLSGAVDSAVMTFRRLLRNWVEAQATWNIYATASNWGTAGGLNNTTDRSVSSGTLTQGNASFGGYYEMVGDAQFRQDVQDFINGSVNNYGWHIERTDGADDTGFRTFASSEGTNGTRPYLSVTTGVANSGGFERIGRGIMRGTMRGAR